MANIIELAKTTDTCTAHTITHTHTQTYAGTWNCRSIMTAHPHTHKHINTHKHTRANTHAHPVVVAPPLLEDFLLPHLHFQHLLLPAAPPPAVPLAVPSWSPSPFYPSGLPHAIGNLFILRPFHICLGPYSMCSVPLPRLMFQVCSVYLLLLLLLLVLSLSLLLLRLFAWPGQWGVSKLFVCQGPSQDIKAAICARHTNDLENCAVFLSVSSNTHT